MLQQPLLGQDLLIIEASRSLSDIPQLMELFWRNDQPVAQRPIPDNTQHSQQTDTSVTLEEFEPAIPASEQQQTHALDRTASGIQSP